ncbi:MAG: hypothetical protein AAB360_00500 [Patescibacteria group bacterium]
MLTETLIQILIGAGIVAVVVLTAVLVYLILILRKIDDAARVMDARIREVNSYVTGLEDMIKIYYAAAKSFLTTLGLGLTKEKTDDAGKPAQKGDKDDKQPQ